MAAVVIQPDFYARGVTDLNLVFNTANKSLKSLRFTPWSETVLLEPDEETQLAIDEIMGRYAPDAQTEIAISENYPIARSR